MGVERALTVVALQRLLMQGARNFDARPAVSGLRHRLLATAASLDYVLMLATDTAGTRIPPDDAARAIHDGLARAADDALVLLRALMPVENAAEHDFLRDGLRTVRRAIAAETLENDERTFALIVLATDLCT